MSNCGSDNVTPTSSVSNCTSFADQVFVEKDGLVIIEIESTDLGENWLVSNGIAGFTGNSYLLWEGGNQSNNPGLGLMTYNIRIETPGTYRFQWRCRLTGDNPTESNDAWLRMPDADDFYGRKIRNDGNVSIVYPKGSGRTPVPEGAGKEGWFKVYVNQIDAWVWGARTSDNDPHDIFAEFDTAGDYTIEVSGRSEGFIIDRMALYLVSGASPVSENTATNDSQAESLTECN